MVLGLSEKAKGKQRAILPPLERAESTINYRNLTVRFTDGIPDITITIKPEDSVRDVKKQIRQILPTLAKRRLRLIHSGRLLSDSTRIFSWLASLEEKQKHAIPDATTADAGENTTSTRQLSPVWIHCSVGAEVTGGDLDEDVNKMQQAQIKPLRGFDRLAGAGFSEEDIASFRRTFHSQSDGDYLDDEDFGEDQDYEEHARTLEEQWIDSLDNANSANLSHSSSPTVLQGILVGFFFPLIPFFFFYGTRPAIFWDDGQEFDRVRSVVFSKRMQVAIALGFAINIILGLWRYLLGP